MSQALISLRQPQPHHSPPLHSCSKPFTKSCPQILHSVFSCDQQAACCNLALRNFHSAAQLDLAVQWFS